MKKILLFLMAVLPLGFASCSSDDDDNEGLNSYEQALVSTWVEYGNVWNYEVMHLELRDDRTGFRWAEDNGVINAAGKIPLTWSATKSTITVFEQGSPAQTFPYMLVDGKLYVSSDVDQIVYERK